MNILKALLLFVLSLMSAAALSANIQVQAVSQHLHILSGKDYGTNIGLVETPSGLVLIDPMPGKAHLAELEKVIKEIHHKPITHILNTHAHDDHSGGNAFFTSQGVQLMAGESSIQGVFHRVVKSHTTTDNIYYHKPSNAIFVGDVFDTSWHPTFYAGGVAGFKNAIDTVLRLGDEQSLVVPGHGVATDKASLRRFRKNTLEWVDTIRLLSIQGLSVEQIMTNKKVIDLAERFNLSGKSPFLPQKAYQRFIERTIQVIEREHGSV
ncbi:MBL fold metallo-hydrolase [Pseudoalteromonas sp. McH1-42]|uniref:MBL fold metallo-hydrolase n=1 Tax=Pseudoalteromonas sp. McH1-42 TaxID=2917752 RepID=UPI001EF489AD|nr:MBL fold metallo-hydrolase [Pseudoalteromonas sp. McH1-42]MCG7563065.1 MBL fold metallo-hydrolase [Pseudoalteromonas sp. McH1-42]